MTGNGRELGGSFALGPWRVRRAGYGAMQLAHLAENLGAADVRLDNAARAELTRHFPVRITGIR